MQHLLWPTQLVQGNLRPSLVEILLLCCSALLRTTALTVLFAGLTGLQDVMQQVPWPTEVWEAFASITASKSRSDSGVRTSNSVAGVGERPGLKMGLAEGTPHAISPDHLVSSSQIDMVGCMNEGICCSQDLSLCGWCWGAVGGKWDTS